MEEGTGVEPSMIAEDVKEQIETVRKGIQEVVLGLTLLCSLRVYRC
jgi:hypothetical protein